VEFPPHRRKKRQTKPNRPEAPVKGRKPLPAHLERREKRLELPEAELVCTCCGKDLVLIGEETSERLCVAPVKYYVERTIRPKYGCKDGCGGIHVAPVPLQVIPKSNASPSLLAQVIASKFCDSLPFYRQSNIMNRDGIDISRATMARWAWESHLQLLPLFNLINTLINTAPVKQMDETRIRVLHDNETGESLPGNSWMWCSAARISRGTENGVEQFMKLISFHYDPGRGMEVAEELLAGFKGVLMSDAYASYNTPSRLGGIEQAACMAHYPGNIFIQEDFCKAS
jgi:transposase